MDEALLPAKRKRDSLDELYVVDKDEEGAKAGRAAGSEQACGSGGSGDGVTVALLSGHDDPCTNEQYTMWKERLFTDVWLQVRGVRKRRAQDVTSARRLGCLLGVATSRCPHSPPTPHPVSPTHL